MFGHNDDHNNDHGAEPQHDAVLGDNPTTVHPDDAVQPDAQNASASPAFTASAPTVPTPAVNDDHDDLKQPAHDTADRSAHGDSLDNGANGDLLHIKQSALKQLSPLVDHLDQTPEEKFRTTMMMIQASDDQTLLKEAYDAAQKITDEKTKAQALLDIVNEINYFTQHAS